MCLDFFPLISLAQMPTPLCLCIDLLCQVIFVGEFLMALQEDQYGLIGTVDLYCGFIINFIRLFSESN